MMSHEKLDVYQRAIEFMAIAARTVESVPRGYGDLRSQLREAATSIPLNIAEGVGKHTEADQRKYFRCARGSAEECGAIFDTLEVMDEVPDADYSEAKELLERIVAMLTKLPN